MEYIVTENEMKQYDRNTIDFFGILSAVLMERAALAVVDEITNRNMKRNKVLILCGCGNNGGDGFAVARLLQQRGSLVTVYFPGNQEKCTEETIRQIRIYEKMGGQMTGNLPTSEYDIIIDALFGIGLNRPIENELAESIHLCNQKNAVRIAVDIPSGIHADSGKIMGTAFKADITVTFAFKKRGQIFYPGADYCGELVCRDIGIFTQSFLGEYPQMYSYQPDDIEKYLPKRKKDGNKGTFGKILMIAGSVDMCGACILSGLSAYRSGAGLIRMITPKENRSLLQKKLPEAVLKCFDISDMENFSITYEENVEWADYIAIGPGIGTGKEGEFLVRQLLNKITNSTGKTILFDADALNIVAKHQELLEQIRHLMKNEVIFTPHMGEFSRLTGKTISELKDARTEIVQKYAEENHLNLVCKDARTICSDGNKMYVNQSGNEGMATAGAGDVLTGIMIALAAQGMHAFEASCLGVFIHGMAGDYAKDNANSYSVMARDIIKQLRKILV